MHPMGGSCYSARLAHNNIAVLKISASVSDQLLCELANTHASLHFLDNNSKKSISTSVVNGTELKIQLLMTTDSRKSISTENVYATRNIEGEPEPAACHFYFAD